MRAWRLTDKWGVDELKLVECESPKPGTGEVLVRIHAASLNARDVRVVDGKMVMAKGPGSARLPLVPFSDGAGEIIAIGEGVTRVNVGDRVCPLFFQSWRDGKFKTEYRTAALGATTNGVLQDEMLLSEDSVAVFPNHLTYIQAATLPCAGLTAWHALVNKGRLTQGETVLIQGTGGVSIFALQFCAILGGRAIVISSSDKKLSRAIELGATHVVNYVETPNWAEAVWALTDGSGVDLVVEVGGADTLQQSLAAAAPGGHVFIIGLLSGEAREIDPADILVKNLSVTGISVGSRTQFETMCEAIAASKMIPIVDSVFPFKDVRDALHFMKKGGYFGKICIDYETA